VGALRGPASPWFQARGYPGASYVTEPDTPWFSFGFGLSYTKYALVIIMITFCLYVMVCSYTITKVTLSGGGKYAPTDTFTATVTVKSKGPAGKVVVQV
jgi:hypothetical protein